MYGVRCSYTVLLRAVAYAGAAGLANQLVGVAGRVAGWITEWNLGPPDARVLLLAMANLFQAAGPSAARDHFAFLGKYLASFQVTAAPSRHHRSACKRSGSANTRPARGVVAKGFHVLAAGVGRLREWGIG